jgi:hypothetical protein
MLYDSVELSATEGKPVQYLAVYVLRWRSEWGEPQVGFVEHEGNAIVEDDFSNPKSETLYDQEWPNEPSVEKQYWDGNQCLRCYFYAAFNSDWGLCLSENGRHRLETVFKHFTCPSYQRESPEP